MASAGVKKRYVRSRTKKQKVWEYLRRNRSFRVGDVMALVNATQRYLKPLLWHLEKAGYLRLSSDADNYRERIYTMLKDTGPKSPSIVNGDVYDHNNKELIHIVSERSAALTGGSYLKLLKAMTQSAMTRAEITAAANLAERSGSTGRCLQHMRLEGIITQTKQRRDGKCLYRIDKHKRAAKIAEISHRSDDVDGHV